MTSPAAPAPSARTGARSRVGGPDGAGAVTAPSSRWYGVGAAVAVAGSVLGAAVVVLCLRALEVGPAGYRRVAVPGEEVLEIDRPGEYRLHGETPEGGGPDGTLFSPLVSLTGPDGDTVAVRTATVSARRAYGVDGRSGYRFASFVVSRPGRYVMVVRARTDGDPPPRTQSGAVAALRPETVAVEAPVRAEALAGVLVGASLFALAWLVASILWFVTVLRRGAGRRMAAAGRGR